MALRVMATLGLDGTGFQQGFARADSTVKRFSSSFNSAIGGRFAAIFSVGAIGYAIRKTIDYAGSLNDLADRTGATVEELQRFDAAAKANGTTLETLISFWERLNASRAEAIRNPAGTRAAAFSTLGIGGAQLRGASAIDISRQIAAAFQEPRI